MRVVLTGFMGTGKTAVGRRLAARLGRELIDTDALIERAAGRSVREIFASEGEASFRERERRAVREACAAPADAVVSTGGGTLLDDASFAALREGSLLVCLTASPRAIARRIRATVAERPLLHGHASLTGRIRELLEARAGSYARVPFQLDTSSLTVEQVVDAIVAELERAESADRARAAGGES
ncbi:MAG: shikimate kinase [Thermodesulfobacteriota bacterium]